MGVAVGPRPLLFQQSHFCFTETILIPRSLLNDYFKDFFSYSFHLKHFFFLFSPGGGRKEKKS